jgi:iron complex transport system permease protein
MSARARFYRTVGFAGLACAALVALSPFLGRHMIAFGDAMAGPDAWPDGFVFWRLRVPRALMAALAGAGLALAGASYQALLRNALATPYTLGVASGGALGAVLAIHLGLAAVVPYGLGVTGAAFVGASLTVSVSLVLAQVRGRLPGTTLVLAGVTLSFFCGALTLFVQYLANPMEMIRMLRWMIGGLDVGGPLPVVRVAPFVVGALVVLMRAAPALNLMSGGDELASSRGVDVDRVRKRVLIAASAVTAAVVAETGPIGFVGLIVPHAMRILVGPDHRILLPVSALAGAAFLALCDAVARSLLADFELPVGILTALMGGPCFLLLLRSTRRSLVHNDPS